MGLADGDALGLDVTARVVVVVVADVATVVVVSVDCVGDADGFFVGGLVISPEVTGLLDGAGGLVPLVGASEDGP